ncbi:MAG TPA: (Fe-S)-binding protein [Acidobacteriota bacterium]|nr:(Fe-S)-binding protein [Acidobacteriota bacterium]
MRVALFTTCLVDQFLPEVGKATVRILEKLGVEVLYDSRQTCCGQPAYNSGHVREARKVVRHFLRVFADAGADAIVVPSGSCATMLKVFSSHLLETDEEEALGSEIGARIFELSDFLVSSLGVEATGASFSESVTFHDSCHQLRELGVRDQPRRLLRAVQGIDFREMDDAERCCGFGGTFAIKFADVSSAMGHDKISRIRESGARVVVSNDGGCLMHLRGLIDRQKAPLRTMHLAEVLARF